MTTEEICTCPTRTLEYQTPGRLELTSFSITCGNRSHRLAAWHIQEGQRKARGELEI